MIGLDRRFRDFAGGTDSIRCPISMMGTPNTVITLKVLFLLFRDVRKTILNELRKMMTRWRTRIKKIKNNQESSTPSCHHSPKSSKTRPITLAVRATFRKVLTFGLSFRTFSKQQKAREVWPLTFCFKLAILKFLNAIDSICALLNHGWENDGNNFVLCFRRK